MNRLRWRSNRAIQLGFRVHSLKRAAFAHVCAYTHYKYRRGVGARCCFTKIVKKCMHLQTESIVELEEEAARARAGKTDTPDRHTYPRLIGPS